MKLPIGVSDYRKLIEYKSPVTNEGYLFVDKSLFIREVIDDGAEVIVITRPRRFGKTLNLSMLQYFFAREVDGETTERLFDDLEIAKYKNCMALQGKQPIVFISFKDVKAANIESIKNKIYEQVRELYEQHSYVLEDNKLSQGEKKIFNEILNQEANLDTLSFALKNLTYFIHRTLAQKVYVLIDEYDTPIQEAYLNGYYEELIAFMRTFLGSALKGNISAKQSILTGILRVAKESLFSDLNNVEIYSILSDKYSEYFGFTEDETVKLLEKTELPGNVAETKEWFNGYQFGNSTIYNPWSIIKFIKEKGKLKSYWVNTSGNDIVKNLIINSSPAIKTKLQTLIAGEVISEIIDEHIVFGYLKDNQAAIWSLLLASGYLKAVSSFPRGHRYVCDLKIPNKEIEYFFSVVVEEWLSGDRGFTWYQELLTDLTAGRVEKFEEKLQILIEEIVSCRDATKVTQEAFYHGLLLGIVAGLKETHIIESNKESGKGFYDVAVIPKDISKLGIVMEFKATEDDNQVMESAQLALKQLVETKYVTDLSKRGITNFLRLGIGFSRRTIKVISG